MTYKETYPEIESMKPRVSELRRVIKVMSQRQVVIAGIVITLAAIIVAIIAPWISPADPIKQDLESMRQPPSSEHLLGTDEYGRDVMSRLIYGTRISILVGVVAVCIAGVLGMLLGLIAGYFGGLVNAIIMRFTDALLALPPIVLMLAIAALLGGGLKNVLVALGIGMMPTYCRLMCGQILSLRESDYVVAARSIGASNLRVMFQHLLPNSFPPLLVLLTTNLGTAIIMEASLSFLGIGISPPTPTWGSMVNSGYPFLITTPLLSIAPGLAIMLVVLAINMVGDGLRDALDPRLRGVF
ncbi:MAG: ABC transporter permease [Dehalococcoidales bacterium]|nr:ABC transporter permease [Dehalococcoidales bacterium]